MIVKVCGMRQATNIRQVEQLAIDWMGFIFHPQSPRYVSHLPAYLPRRTRRVGVFLNAMESFILERITTFGLHILQLHGQESPDFCGSLRFQTGLPIIKAFGIDEHTDWNALSSYETVVDYFLFDTRCPQGGGSGLAFDHRLLANYRGNTPFLLSGGLGPNSLEDLQQFNHPLWAGIDLNSRFEIAPAIKAVAPLNDFLIKFRNTFPVSSNSLSLLS